MVKRWTDHKTIMATAGASAKWGHAWWFLGAILAVVGIIGEAIDTTLGLEPTSWFLLAIAIFLAGMGYWVYWAVALLLDVLETKSK